MSVEQLRLLRYSGCHAKLQIEQRDIKQILFGLHIAQDMTVDSQRRCEVITTATIVTIQQR